MMNKVKLFANWVSRLSVWLMDGRGLFITVVAPSIAVVIVLAIGYPSWEASFRISGMVMQIWGLASVVAGIRQIQHSFYRPSFRDISSEWLEKWPDFRKNYTLNAGTVSSVLSGMNATITANGTVVHKDRSLEERVNLLEERLKENQKQISKTQQQIEKEIQDRTKVIEAEQQERKSGDERNRDLTLKVAVDGIELEAYGAVWIFVGIGFASGSVELEILVKYLFGS